jgi:hypothetical protein
VIAVFRRNTNHYSTNYFHGYSSSYDLNFTIANSSFDSNANAYYSVICTYYANNSFTTSYAGLHTYTGADPS